MLSFVFQRDVRTGLQSRRSALVGIEVQLRPKRRGNADEYIAKQRVRSGAVIGHIDSVSVAQTPALGFEWKQMNVA